MSFFLTLWGLFLTYALSPFAVFAFLNRLLGDETTRSPRFFVACLGLGPLALSWSLLALMAVMPGRPYSLHLWTLTGIVALLLAISERSGLDCAKNVGFGFLRLLSDAREAFRLWRQNWPSFILLAVATSFLAALFMLCAMLPPSGSDALMSLSLAIDGHEGAQVSRDVSSYGGLLIWSYIFQGSVAEAGVAKYICPAFALYASLLALALPLRSLFERCVALCLVLVAIFPHALLLNSLTLRIYALLLLVFLALSFKRGMRLFVCVTGVLAAGSLLRLCEFAAMPVDGRLCYLLAAFAAAVIVAKLARGFVRTFLLGALALALFVPEAKFAMRKAAEFPLAWEIPALPEVAIVDNSANGRFAMFNYIHANFPPGSVTLTPFPWDFDYYAPDRYCVGVDSGVNRLPFPADLHRSSTLLGIDFLCLPPPSESSRPALKRLEELASDASKAEKVYERDSWRIYKLQEAQPSL